MPASFKLTFEVLNPELSDVNIGDKNILTFSSIGISDMALGVSTSDTRQLLLHFKDFTIGGAYLPVLYASTWSVVTIVVTPMTFSIEAAGSAPYTFSTDSFGQLSTPADMRLFLSTPDQLSANGYVRNIQIIGEM